MRTRLALAISLVLGVALVAGPAFAGFTLVEKDYVGGTENKNKVGGGDQSAASAVASRFAGSDNTIAEGPPPGGGGPDYTVTGGQTRETFGTTGTLPVSGASSVNGFPVYSNFPTCPDPTGAGLDSVGLPASYSWTIALERPVVSDIQVQICLDIRKCQEEDDALGSSSTVSITDFEDGLGWEAPTYLRLTHIPGSLNPLTSSRFVPDIVVPGLSITPVNTSFIDLPVSADPDEFEESPILAEAVSFIGRDCITKWIPNDGQYAARDAVRVELKVPSSTRVRVRASQDSAAVCYVGTPLPGECDTNPELCGL